MKLAYRAALREDFTSFYENCFFQARDNVALREIVEYEWCILLENPATITLVVEDEQRPAGTRIVGCGQLAFVTDRFVAWAKSGQSPQINVHVTRRLPDGTWPLLTPAQVALANAKGRLNGLYTRWGRANDLLSPAEQSEVGLFMHESGMDAVRGYQFKELLIQAYTESVHEQALRAGFLDRNAYDKFWCGQGKRPADLPYLMGITREEAAHMEGCIMPYFFIYNHPRFSFTRREQEILSLCLQLQDASDNKLAETLGVSLSAVKNWWQAIYQDVTKAAPDLLPLTESCQKRGPEKRRLLLQYLRKHPEELRPYKKPRRIGKESE